ncbi:hypothetical protein BDR22DRAFT_822421 [Usnea florida]
MYRTWALASVLLQSLSAPIVTSLSLARSVPAAKESLSQHTVIPKPSSALQLFNASHSLSLHENLTFSARYHIPDTTIDLVFALGTSLDLNLVLDTLELAADKIATDVALHPTTAITNGFFQQRHEGVVIRFHQYVDKQITWSLLGHLLLGIWQFFSRLGSACELRFEIDVENDGRVGFGSLWHIGLEDNDVERRAVNESGHQLSTVNTSNSALSDSNHVFPLHVPDEHRVIFSYHFFGEAIPASALSTCFGLARQSIRTNLQLRPDEEIPGGTFRSSPDSSRVTIGIEAYIGREFTWLLLDQILLNMSEDLIGRGPSFTCTFEIDVYPYDEPYGYGFLWYGLAAPLTAG